MAVRKYIIVVASGVGKRMGENTPKQFLLLKGKPVLVHTLENIYKAKKDYSILLVLNSRHLEVWEEIKAKYHLNIPHKVVVGGRERFFSVKNAIDTIEDKEAWVAVHDGVRPLISKEIVDNCFFVAEKEGNAVCCMDCTDSVRIINNNESNQSIDRGRVKLIQTPQCFALSVLRKAYLQPYREEFTDDASVVESLGEKITLCKGDRHNIKITTPLDMTIAESLL